jgi:hypothetical protein
VNASASALPREAEVQAKIRKVRTFGRGARGVCTALFWLLLVGFGLMPIAIMIRLGTGAGFAPTEIRTPSTDNGDLYDVLVALLTPLQLALCVFFILGVVIGVLLATLSQLHGLFGNLAAGAIYTTENVRRIRNVGFLQLVLAVLGVVIPTAIVVARGFIDTSVPIDRVFPSLSEVISPFVTAGLVLLASWIMDVGLYEKDHADALQRDADLTI